MAKKTYFTLETGFVFEIEQIDREQLPKAIASEAASFTTFWRAHFPGMVGVCGAGTDERVFIVACGYPGARNQHVVWYPNGSMWISFGTSVKNALARACKDAYRYI